MQCAQGPGRHRRCTPGAPETRRGWYQLLWRFVGLSAAPHCPPASRWSEPRNQKWHGLCAEHQERCRWCNPGGRGLSVGSCQGSWRVAFASAPRGAPFRAKKMSRPRTQKLAAIPGPALAVRAATGAVRPRKVLGGVLTDGSRPLRPRAALSELEETLLRKLRPGCLGSEIGFN